mmetsp:Transcript_12344/g.26869  ORF Transcript_12344/g.26869 Transcript_12344/m.26869 type:complete len:161 (+) Transcript_12344:1382-1864(+)
MEYRTKFNKDIVVDIIGYRRLGHNEIDTPEFTQPQMYKEIKARQNIYNLYKEELIREGDMTVEEAEAQWDFFTNHYKVHEKMAEDTSLAYKEDFEYITPFWRGYDPKVASVPKLTGFDKSGLDRIAKTLFTIPEGFNAHPIIKNVFKARRENYFEKQKVD